jgi:hypothetical protein
VRWASASLIGARNEVFLSVLGGAGNSGYILCRVLGSTGITQIISVPRQKLRHLFTGRSFHFQFKILAGREFPGIGQAEIALAKPIL